MPRGRGRHKQLRARAFLPSLVALPLTLLVGAWAINAMQGPTSPTDTGADRKPVAKTQPPVVPPVPDNPYIDPAHAPGRSGELGLGVGTATAADVVGTLKSTGIPASALRAYALAQAAMVEGDEPCHLPWTLMAAIGRVESNHGRVDESTLTRQGKAVPAIVGPSLDGGPGLPHVADTDEGAFDQDGSFDRGVGPMQFLPETWRSIGIDADRDSKLDPQDVDDATLAGAVYLCSGSDDLATSSGLKTALGRYNSSPEYADLVVAVKTAYEAGEWQQVADGRQLPPPPKTPGSPDPGAPDPAPSGDSQAPPGPDAPGPDPVPTGGPAPGPDPAPTGGPKPDPSSPVPGPVPSKDPKPSPNDPRPEPPKPGPTKPAPSPSPTSDDDDGGLELPLPLPPLPIPLPLLLAPV
ncbi:lytic transglycosylase domain-containing protein [Tenggerimyces flavus]|uniref:Lytic transglycosylase domain-containing protein n=1 Tax=Tenggerimyces flavus TaxID=1708749 RepID=A0ABV7Y9E0_9ACTN